MTDKLKLFKVRLASGAERVIVAPGLGAVAQLTFASTMDGSDDAVLGVDFAGDVDFVILREPVPQPELDQVLLPPQERQFMPKVIRETRDLAFEAAKPRSSPPFGVGDVCPECGGILHATLGQLVCSLGHQVGPVPEGTFHNHTSTDGPRAWCKACELERQAAGKRIDWDGPALGVHDSQR